MSYDGYGGGDLRGFSGFQHYGSIFGCPGLALVIQDISNAIGSANVAGVSQNDPDYVAATGAVSGAPLFEFTASGCASDTANAQSILNNLNAKIQAAGSVPPAPLTAPPAAPGDNGGILGGLNPFSGGGGMPTWMIGILAVVGVVGVAWLGSSVAKIYVAKKKVA
jgi:hypothetical protein